MKVYEETSLNQFRFWAGGKDNAERLTYEELEQVEFCLEDIYPDGIEDTQINDIFWFDFEWVCECIGAKYNVDEDEIIRDGEEDEDEEGDED